MAADRQLEALPPRGHGHRARPTGCACTSPGVDLIRDEEGTFRVLEDNVRVPSGVSYVIANRRAMANVFPEAFATMRIRPVHDYPRMLLAALRASAPDGASDPTVVVLTPGVFNSAYFEHALLARMMGVELVEGRDLVCVGGQVRMRTTTGDKPGRRHLPPGRRRVPRPGALPRRLGARRRRPGLGDAQRPRHRRQRGRQRRRRRQADLLLPARPDPVLPRRGPDPGQRRHLPAARSPARSQHVLDHLEEMVVKPVDGSGGKGLVVGTGPTAHDARQAAQAAPRPTRAAGSPSRSCSSRPSRPSSTTGCPAPRRPAPVRGQRRRATCWVLPGGLTRVALPEGELVVNSQPGRRLEGHLGGRPTTAPRHGARPRRRPRRRPGRGDQVDADRSTPSDSARPGRRSDAPTTQQEQQQQQTLGAAAEEVTPC